MNEYEKAIDALDLSLYIQGWCCVCGKAKDHGHHIIFRSHGGTDKHIVHLCIDCHRHAHARKLHFVAMDGNLYFYDFGVSSKIDRAAQKLAQLREENMHEYYNLKIRQEAYMALWESCGGR